MVSVGNPRITLELEVGADPIRGTIDHPDGTSLCFWGWLELMEDLRRLAAGHPPQPCQPSPTTNTQKAEVRPAKPPRPATTIEEQP